MLKPSLEEVKALAKPVSYTHLAPQQITPDELETILEAGRSAPSGMNQQSAIAVAVQSKAELAQLVELAKAAVHQDHNPFYDAPTVILVFAKMTNLAPMEDGCTAVSYTHLDVYKRQVHSPCCNLPDDHIRWVVRICKRSISYMNFHL